MITMSTIRSKFAPLLVGMRRRHNYTQREVAEQIKVPRSTYAALEESRAQPTMDVLNRILKLYNKPTLEELLS
jgi:transcriptional regulator with XRE-family HTH domain